MVVVVGACASLQLDLSASSGLGSRRAAVQWQLGQSEAIATAPIIDDSQNAACACTRIVKADTSLLPAGYTTIKLQLCCSGG